MPTLTPTLAAFTVLDWIVMAGYFAMIAGTGFILNRKQDDTNDYFLAHRRIPMWAAATSLMATALSAATFIGAPEMTYRGDFTYLSFYIGVVVAILVIARFFIPVFYRLNVATVYELLSRRFGQPARSASSATFMVGRALSSGARVFMASLPLALIVFGTDNPAALHAAIIAMTIVGIGYTLVGGIASVIWADVIQAVVFVFAAAAAIWLLLDRIPADLPQIVDTLAQPDADGHSKLTALKFGLNLDKPGYGFSLADSYTLLTALTGFVLLNLAAYGTDHDMVQRLLTCRDARRGSGSALMGVLITIPVVAMFLVIGSLLYLFYHPPAAWGAATPAHDVEASRKVFLSFIIHEVPAGLSGLMIAGLFAAGLSSLNSALNAMSSTFVNDFYRRWSPDRGEAHYLYVGRIGVAAWGVVLCAFACLCVHWQRGSGQTLIDFALNVMVFAYAGLAAVFITAIFTSRGNNASVIAALVTGVAATAAMQPWAWKRWAPEGWGDVTIAFPWQMLFATSLALAVCLAGPPQSRGARALDA